jgi:hypothetical protein
MLANWPGFDPASCPQKRHDLEHAKKAAQEVRAAFLQGSDLFVISPQTPGALVQRLASGMLQPFDLVLHHQFSAL